MFDMRLVHDFALYMGTVKTGNALRTWNPRVLSCVMREDYSSSCQEIRLNVNWHAPRDASIGRSPQAAQWGHEPRNLQ